VTFGLRGFVCRGARRSESDVDTGLRTYRDCVVWLHGTKSLSAVPNSACSIDFQIILDSALAPHCGLLS